MSELYRELVTDDEKMKLLRALETHGAGVAIERDSLWEKYITELVQWDVDRRAYWKE